MFKLKNAPRTLPETLARVGAASVIPRVWSNDHTVWGDDPAEIADRLDWLHLPETMPAALERIDRFVDGVREDGFQHVLLLGMGGSSLAPETFSRVFAAADGRPSLDVLDSTHPDAVRAVEKDLDLSRTLFIVATKSGTTTETLSFFRHFYRRIGERSESDSPGGRFVAITDPGSPLVDLAHRNKFRDVIINNPNLGGRYSALSHFGLVPAALIGVDVRRLLARARDASIACAPSVPLDQNPAAELGALLGAAAAEGRDKLTFILSDAIAPFGAWVEQLVAESTGKDGTGILPVVGEPLAEPEAYGDDRLFVHLRFRDDESQDAALERLAEAGHPVARFETGDRYALGEQIFLWELGTAIAGHLLRINPFDQPNVESAKAQARKLVDVYRRTGRIPSGESEPLTTDRLSTFLDPCRSGDYIAVHAYVRPSDSVTDASESLRASLLDRFGLATTFGYGPRFLHSTGQLHKGDRGNGRFVQLIADPRHDLPIPDDASSDAASLTFGTLITAQAWGDRRALLDGGRPVATYVVPPDPATLIRQMADKLGLRE